MLCKNRAESFQTELRFAGFNISKKSAETRGAKTNFKRAHGAISRTGRYLKDRTERRVLIYQEGCNISMLMILSSADDLSNNPIYVQNNRGLFLLYIYSKVGS